MRASAARTSRMIIASRSSFLVAISRSNVCCVISRGSALGSIVIESRQLGAWVASFNFDSMICLRRPKSVFFISILRLDELATLNASPPLHVACQNARCSFLALIIQALARFDFARLHSRGLEKNALRMLSGQPAPGQKHPLKPKE